MSGPTAALWATTLAGLAHAAWSTTVLPEHVASSFGAGGQPQGWMERGTWVALDVALVLLIAASFLVIGPVLRRAPPDRVSLPNRTYWLAPERRTRSIRWLVDALHAHGALTMAFLVAVMHLVVQANRGAGGLATGALLLGLAGLGLATVVLLVAVFKRFGRPT